MIPATLPPNHPARLPLLLGAANGFLSVLLGAFGAHALKTRVTPELLDIFKVGIQYHQMHAVALVLLAAVAGYIGVRTVRGIALLWSVGILLFSGSLYAYALTGATAFALITPLGGLCFMAGWVWLLVDVTRSGKDR